MIRVILMADYPDRIITLHVRLEQIAKFSDGKTRRVLSDMQDKLALLLLKSGVPGSQNAWQVMDRAYSQISRDAMKQVEAIIERNSTAGIEAARAAEVASMAQLGVDAQDYFKAVDASGVYNRAMKRPLPGLGKGVEMNAGDMITKMSGGNRAAVKSIARRGFVEGLSVPQMSRLIRDSTDLTYKQAKSVTRTAIQSAANQARDDVAESLDEFINKEMWMATLDSRTCPYCQGRDGLCKEKGKLPRPPAHPNCRCVLLYLPEGTSCAEMKKDIDRPYRDPETGKSIKAPYKDFGSWIQTQPKWFQEQVLGKRRAQLLRTGQIGFGKMYTRSGDRKTLEQLGVIKPRPLPKPKPKPQPVYAPLTSKLGPETAGLPFGATAGAIASRAYAAGVHPSIQASWHEWFMEFDVNILYDGLKGKKVASYSPWKNTINIAKTRKGQTRTATTFMHEFGHRTDYVWGKFMHQKWGTADGIKIDRKAVSNTKQYLKATFDDQDLHHRIHRDGIKKVGGTENTFILAKGRAVRDIRKEMLDANATTIDEQILWLKKQKLPKEYDYLVDMLDEQIALYKKHGKDDEGFGFYDKYAKEGELNARRALVLAAKHDADAFILQDFLNGLNRFYMNKDAPDLPLYLKDAIGSTSRNLLVDGHETAYYSDLTWQSVEAFANQYALRGHGHYNKFIQKYMPEQAKLFDEFIAEVEKFDAD